ncbi:Magnesium transporter CorA-like family protein [Prunus dulcis]|uniref:Magnesium transporter CorA-like family protein n=1 Tax=Prunus dulcis TaxID=3755 RepID=A0A4Y1RA31_PRUDU|nr:Magnesium transporter CorA-like family protein [Prunus dulcis]
MDSCSGLLKIPSDMFEWFMVRIKLRMLPIDKSRAGENSSSRGYKMKKLDSHKNCPSRDAIAGSDLWTDGLICAFEFIRGRKKSISSKPGSRILTKQQTYGEHERLRVPSVGFSESSSPMEDRNKSPSDDYRDSQIQHDIERFEGEIVQTVQADFGWACQEFGVDDEDDFTVADLAAPYWERPAGPIWWCHKCPVATPAVSLALRDESRLISDRMKHLLYEVPVRVAGGLLFELLGQSAGNPFVDEDDIPIVLRSWQAQNFLVTVLHIKGHVSSVNVLGITEVQELLSTGGYNVPRTAHEVIAHLTCRLSRWMIGYSVSPYLGWQMRRNHEDMNLLFVILNQEIRKLSRQVIRVKWSLHAREEIVFELFLHLRGNVARNLLEQIRKSTREMIEEQEAVRGRLFTIQDVMQSTVRAWLQDRSLRVTHNLAVFGGGGLVLSIITGLFGINVDGMPGAQNAPYAFGVFAAILVFLGVVLIAVGLLYLGLKKPITEEQVKVRKLELQELVEMFQHEAETHAQW